MNIITMAIVTALSLFCAIFVMAQKNDWMIVPGKRLASITAETSRTDLVRLFGKSNVEDKPVDTGEGPEPATVVFAKSPSAAIAVLWRDNLIDRILVCYERQVGPCKWHTSDGVSLGTSLAKLERLNGRPFAMEPWGSDVGGHITSWQGGRLAAKFGDAENAQMRLTLDWNETASGPTPQQREALEQIDRQHRAVSSDSSVRRLHPAITRIVLAFPSKKACK